MGSTKGSSVIASSVCCRTWSTRAGHAVNGRRRTTTCMTLSRYHIDFKLSAKQSVSITLANTRFWAADSTAWYVLSKVYSVSSPVSCFGKNRLDCVPRVIVSGPSIWAKKYESLISHTTKSGYEPIDTFSGWSKLSFIINSSLAKVSTLTLNVRYSASAESSSPRRSSKATTSLRSNNSISSSVASSWRPLSPDF